mmetsp:Transcript_84018/g.241531  ORF Transcript_84018/g.241531 Transcript_84018/m.241531 type:complete len:255 (-) Transcript_84018:725-1489(-)
MCCMARRPAEGFSWPWRCAPPLPPPPPPPPPAARMRRALTSSSLSCSWALSPSLSSTCTARSRSMRCSSPLRRLSSAAWRPDSLRKRSNSSTEGRLATSFNAAREGGPPPLSAPLPKLAVLLLRRPPGAPGRTRDGVFLNPDALRSALAGLLPPRGAPAQGALEATEAATAPTAALTASMTPMKPGAAVPCEASAPERAEDSSRICLRMPLRALERECSTHGSSNGLPGVPHLPCASCSRKQPRISTSRSQNFG